MSLRERWNRVDAEPWVYLLLAARALVLMLLTQWAFVVALAHGVVLLTAIPATLAALSGWLAVAWRRERRWAWYAAAIVAGMGVAGNLQGALAGRATWLTAALLVFDALVLALVFHPRSHARVSGPPAVQGPPAQMRPSVEQP